MNGSELHRYNATMINYIHTRTLVEKKDSVILCIIFNHLN